MKTKSRLNYIDVARGICILSVLVSHTEIPLGLLKNTFDWNLPMFFFLSGYLFNREKTYAKGFWKYTLGKIKSLLIPYWIMTLINLAYKVYTGIAYLNFIGLDSLTIKAQILEYIRQSILGILFLWHYQLPDCGTCWFFLTMFICVIVMYFAMKPNKKWARIAIAIVMLFVYGILYQHGYERLIWNSGVVLVAVPLMMLGYEARQYRILEADGAIHHGAFAIIIFALVGITVNTCNSDYILFAYNKYGNVWLAVITMACLDLTILWICKNFLSNARILPWIGRGALLLAGFNYRFIDCSYAIWSDLGFQDKYGDIVWWQESILVILVGILLLLIWDGIKIMWSFAVNKVKSNALR